MIEALDPCTTTADTGDRRTGNGDRRHNKNEEALGSKRAQILYCTECGNVCGSQDLQTHFFHNMTPVRHLSIDYL